MLVFSRKVGEVIVINENVKVTVVKIDGNKVRIGVDAPKSVPINRLEIQQLIQEREQR